MLHIFLDTGVLVAGLAHPLTQPALAGHPAQAVLALASRRVFSPVIARRVLWEVDQVREVFTTVSG